MLNKKEIHSIQDKILNSHEFANSQINKSLLQFLFQSFLKDEIPKETSIALEIFDRSQDFNPNEDTIVRVHMFHLRNKLEAYYQNEGKNDKYKLNIPKGHYALEFLPRRETAVKSPPTYSSLSKIYFIIIICFLILLCLYLWISNRNANNKIAYYQLIDKRNPIWAEYLQNDLPTLIVLGNNLFFSEYDKDLEKWRYVRDLNINTMEELNAYKAQFPLKKIQPTDEAYFPDGSIWSLPPILSVFYSVPKPVILRRLVDVTPEIIHENNIIFLGSLKTLGLFSQYISCSHFKFKFYPHRIIYNSPDSSISDTLVTSYNQSTGYHRDLAIALKLPGPNDNAIMLITSFFSSGAPEVAKYLANPVMLRQLRHQFIQQDNKVPPYFEILFEVRGVIKTGFYLEAKYLNEISEDVKIW